MAKDATDASRIVPATVAAVTSIVIVNARGKLVRFHACDEAVDAERGGQREGVAVHGLRLGLERHRDA